MVSKQGWRDVVDGLVGIGGILIDYATPFLRPIRSRWGIDAATAARAYPGDGCVPDPRWTYTHGVEIDAPPEAVWPWLTQIGQDKAGFYSYSWLENLAGSNIHNADSIHPEWQALQPGDGLRLHPKVPPLTIVEVEPGRYFVARSTPPDQGGEWVLVSWLFFVEPLPGGRSRVVSRYRCKHSDQLKTRLSFGAMPLEPIAFVMDRRMLLGLKSRVEARATGLSG